MSAKQFILGLNSFNCKSKISNVNWDNNLNQPLTITEGDQINVRNVFLDTRTQSTNGIIIAEDTEISLDFYFYYINRGGNQQPSPFDVSLNYPGQSAIPQPIQTGMFDFLNPLNYSVGANAGSIAPQLIPPKEINILSLSRTSDIATCTLIPTTKSIPLSTQVSIVEIGSNIPPVVSFDATNVTISDILYTGGSTTFQYASSGPDETVTGSVEAPVGICYTNGKLLATASSPNIGNKAPLVESIMYPDFYGGFVPGEPRTEVGINENPAAMIPSTNYTAWVDYNNPANAGITKVEAGWAVTALDTSQQNTGQNLQQSPNTQTIDVSYTSVFDSGAYPDLANVQVGDLVTFPGFTGTPQSVISIVYDPDETQVTVEISLDLVNNNPATSTILNCSSPDIAPFPGIGGFIPNATSELYVTLNYTQVSFDASGGFCVFTTIGEDPSRADFLPIAVGYAVSIQAGEATGTITQIDIDPETDEVQFFTDIPYFAPPLDYIVEFSTTTGNFYAAGTTMVAYDQITFQMTMSNVALDQICGQFYYDVLPPSLQIIIQNADFIEITYIATQTIYVQDLLFTFTPLSSILNSVVSSTAYITSPVTAYAITFPTNTTSIPTPNGLIMTFTQDRPTFSNLSNLNNFSIPMNLNSGDGLPYLAYMNLSQSDNQGNPTGICDPTKRVPIKKRFKMIIKAGSYSADRLAQIISRNMSRQKNKIQRNYYLNEQLSIAVTPTDGINKQYRGLIQYTEPYNPIPIDVAVAVPDFLLDNFAGYANGAFTQGYPTQLYNPSRFYLSKNPKSYPQNSDIPLTTTKLQNLSPDYESQYLFDDDDQPFLFRPTSYAKPNPLAVTAPTNEINATQETNDLNYESEIPNPDINPMTEGETFTAYFPSFETTPFTESGQTTFALYAVNVPGYEVVADDNLYQIQLPSMTGIGTEDDVQFLLNYLVVWTGMDNTLPVPQIITAAYNNDGYFAFNFDYFGAVPVGGSFAGNFSFIFPFQLPLIQITESWTALRLNLEPAPGPATQVEANIFNNEIYAYQISFKGDATIADTTSVEILFSLAGEQGDINQRQDYLYSAGMCYNDANLFKWNKMQPNLIAPPNLVDVYFGPFLTDCYSPFFQKQIKDSNVSTGGYDSNGLSSYYAIRPVITQQMEYIIYENTTLVQNGEDVDVSSNYLFAYAPNYEVVCPLIGASEMSLVYNAENNGIFQFNYAHTPLYAKVASGTSSTVVESVGQYPSYVYPYEVDETDAVKLATPAEGVFQADKQSGIILAAMNPPAFWELLGFDISACIANPPSNDVGAPFMTFEEFAVKTTGGFSGSGNNFDTSITMVGDSLQSYAASADTFSLESGVNIGIETSASIAEPYFINKYTQTPIFYEVQNTNTIDAASIPLAPSAAGFWLVEITGYSSEFITDIEKMEVKAIVNGYFSQGGAFATTNGSDSYSYRHAGQPIQLSNLKIRILNPITGQEDKTLGPNNSVYLEISKQIPAPNLPIINNDSNVQVPWSNPNPVLSPPPKK